MKHNPPTILNILNITLRISQKFIFQQPIQKHVQHLGPLQPGVEEKYLMSDCQEGLPDQQPNTIRLSRFSSHQYDIIIDTWNICGTCRRISQ